MDVYTIGHSTHSIDEFLLILKKYNIETLVDVRSYPGSNYVPQFNKENMEKCLKENNIKYIHMPDLGGRRNKNKGIDSSLIDGWEKATFRNYAAYSLTEEYEEAINKLISLAEKSRLSYMCSEALPWRCHRLIISNTLISKGINVYHIMTESKKILHELGKYGAEAIIKDSKVIYPKDITKED